MQRTLKTHQSEGSIMSTIKSSMTESSKCPSCTKSVYHVEEIICSGSTWHKDCFKCGGAGDFGCQRKLNLSDFTLNTAVPYCKGCYIKVISKPVVAAEEIIVGASSGSDRTDLNDLNGFVKISERRSSFGASGKACVIANALAIVRLACPKCTKTVFKAEEIQLAGFSWHKACFTCGGASETDGCKRTLNAQDFHPHRGNPFCKGCIGKQPILDKKKTDSRILRSETEISEMSQETSIYLNGSSTKSDAPASSTTTVESIDSPSSRVHQSPTATKAPVTVTLPTALTAVTASVAVATSVPVAAVPSPANVPIVAVASTTKTTIATIVSVDKDMTVDGVEVETSYQDENGMQCTMEGEPLTSSSRTSSISSPGKPRQPVKAVTKFKKYFETVFGLNKKQPDVPSISSPEKPDVVELKEEEAAEKEIIEVHCTDEDTLLCSKDGDSEKYAPCNTPKRSAKIRTFFTGLIPYKTKAAENAVEVPTVAVPSD